MWNVQIKVVVWDLIECVWEFTQVALLINWFWKPKDIMGRCQMRWPLLLPHTLLSNYVHLIVKLHWIWWLSGCTVKCSSFLTYIKTNVHKGSITAYVTDLIKLICPVAAQSGQNKGCFCSLLWEVAALSRISENTYCKQFCFVFCEEMPKYITLHTMCFSNMPCKHV